MYQCDLDYRTPEHWRYQADFTVALCLMNKALLFLNILFSCSSIEKRWREVVYNKTPSCQVTAILSSGSTVAVFWQHEDIPKLVEAGSWWTSCWCTLKACMYVNHMEWQGGVSQLYTGMFGFGEFNSQDLRYVIYCCAFSYRIAFFFPSLQLYETSSTRTGRHYMSQTVRNIWRISVAHAPLLRIIALEKVKL